jgi:hypothetical protein
MMYGVRGEVDDSAAPGLAHDRRGDLHPQEYAADVDRHHTVPLLDRDFLQRLVSFEIGKERGIVHPDVDPTEVGLDLLGKRIDRGFVRYVRVVRLGLGAAGRYFLRRGTGILHVRQRNVRPGLRKPNGQRLSDSLGGPGHNRYTALEVHIISPV